MSIGHFLGGVAALIWDAETCRYLLLRRSVQRDFQRGAWECVTGRVEQGESYTQALQREVREEIGAEVQPEFILCTTHFYRGEELPENELLGVVYACTLKGDTPLSALRMDAEHSEMHWASAGEVQTMLPAGHWLREVVARAEFLRPRLSQEVLDFYQQRGLEI